MKRSRPNTKTRRTILVVLGLLCLAVFCVSSYMVVTRLVRQAREERAFEALVSQLPARAPLPQVSAPQDPAETQPDAPVPPDEPQAPEPGDDGGDSGEPGALPEVLPHPSGQTDTAGRYDLLYEQNEDMFGWICIEGTDINFPVMHTPDDPEHYLHRAFDGSYSYSGCPFLAWNCYTDCGNYIVYGHHMTNGTMFATLMKYARESWWREHPIIQFDTLDKLGDYEVLSAFYTQVYHVNEEGVFKYYAYNELTDQETFDEFVRQAREAALYDTGVEANFGDQLLTLITCNDHTKNGRFVVIARLAQTAPNDSGASEDSGAESPAEQQPE